MSPAQFGARSSLEAVLPALLGGAAGLGALFLLVSTIGSDGPVAGSDARVAVLGGALGIVGAIVAVGAVAAASYHARFEHRSCRLRLLARLLNPLTRLLIVIGNAITPGRGFPEGPFTSEVELRELVDMASDRGVVDAGERQMIHSVFELGDTIAREVMVPRTEIVWIEQTKTVRQALALCLRTGFSRIPVIAESVDDIVGVVNIKDLVQYAMEEADGTQVAEVMRPPSFVPDSKRLDVLLKEMQLSRNHMAIAVDEYGGTAGLLTIEDIVEEIVGEITDEYDADERPPVEELDGGAVRVSARLPVEDLGELFGTEFEHADVDTVGGLLAQRLGRVPLPGAVAELNGLRLRAEGGKDNRGRMRITTVLVERIDVGAAKEHAEERSDIGA